MKQNNRHNNKKTQIILVSAPESLETAIIDNAKYYSQQYLKQQNIFSSNNNMKATKKKLFMSKWITKIQYNPRAQQKYFNTNNINMHMKLQKPLSADDLYKHNYPKNIKLHKIKILFFLDPNTYNKNTNHTIKIPTIYDQYKNIHHKYGDIHITYLPAAKYQKDSYHTSCDYNGYHFTYKLYDYVNLKKQNGIQYIAETFFYKQKINTKSGSGKRYSKKQILDLKSNNDDHYIAFLLSFIWNLFYLFDESCKNDRQIRKSVKFKICKKMAQILNKQHYNQNQSNKNNINWNINKKYRIPKHKSIEKHLKQNKNKINNCLSYSPSTGPNNYTSKYYNNGTLKMEMW